MCGIVGYIGNKNAVPILLRGLERLEYRGYDSAGVAVYSEKEKEIIVCKTKGRVENLETKLYDNPIKGRIGIGHTRWATHGIPPTQTHTLISANRAKWRWCITA